MRYALTLLDTKYQDLGLLLLRAGLGVMFIIFHGGPKLAGGPDQWEGIGARAGFESLPVLWGFLAAFAESFGAFFLLIGLFTRFALLFLIATMVMAATYHLGNNDGWSGASRAIEMGIVFVGLFFVGPGRFSLDAWMRSERARAA